MMTRAARGRAGVRARDTSRLQNAVQLSGGRHGLFTSAS
jgi:hypothetical protein